MPSVVVDASLVLRLVIDEPGSLAAQALWEAWKENRTSIAAPTLLIYEAVNGLHRAWKGGWLTVDEVKESITLLIRFPIHYYSPQELADRAAQLARDFQLEATYDTFYMALAEMLNCEFWTGDRRLYNAVQRKAKFVHSIWEGASP
jgi:predicted nucleic acid-binding protein